MPRLAVLAALLVLVPRVADAARYLQGVVEGYYGRPWSGEARRDVIRFLGAHGMNTFVYGPKNDPFHRDAWREPYPAGALADLRLTAREAHRAGVVFVYAISPALDVCYTCPEDARALRRKLRQLVRARIERFAVFFDDAPTTLAHPADVAAYGGSGPEALARAQAALVRRTSAWLRRRGLPRLAFMVPTDYYGTACSPYLGALDEALPRRMAVGWTGTAVIPATITAEEARARRGCLGDRPLVLWDNYPVNDAILSSNLHLGPFTGRAPDLRDALEGGHLLNPMTQAHASLVALGTAAAYFADPAAYDPEAAWHATLAELAPPGTLDVLAEQTRSSALDLDDAPALAAAIDAVEAAYAGPDWRDPVAQLASEGLEQFDAAREIGTALGATPLGAEIAPWVDELLAHAIDVTRAVSLLNAMKPGFDSIHLVTTNGGRRATGTVSPPLGDVVAELGPLLAAPLPMPTIPELAACLGPLTTAEIRFCPELGLNVHGKRLYLVLGAPFSIVTGLNQRDRLWAFAGAAYGDWVSRQTGSDALGLTIDGVPVPLDAGNGFDAVVAPAGPIRLVVTTDAGDATAIVWSVEDPPAAPLSSPGAAR